MLFLFDSMCFFCFSWVECWELTYPLLKTLLSRWIFLISRWNILVTRRVTLLVFFGSLIFEVLISSGILEEVQGVILMFFVAGKHHQKMHPIKQKSPAFEFNKPKHKKSERKDKSEICFMEISEVDPASSNHLFETSREIKQTVQAGGRKLYIWFCF